MTRRRGVSSQDVVDVAAALVDARGAAALTLSGVARQLGVKPPSLYNHTTGLDALRRDVALRAVDDFGRRLGAAAMGRAGREALCAMAAEFRAYATAHPGLYEIAAPARPDDEEFAAAQVRAVEPVRAVLRSYELDEVATIHAARTLRSALHGFVALEAVGGFGLDVDVDASFDWLVDRLSAAIESNPTR